MVIAAPRIRCRWGLVLVCAVVTGCAAETPAEAPGAPLSGATAMPLPAAPAMVASHLTVVEPEGHADAGEVLFHVPWGSGPGELGMEEHAARVGPLSFALQEDGAVVVVDTVNHRLQRFGADGTVDAVIPLGAGVGERIAIGADGTLFVLIYSREARASGHPTGYLLSRFDAAGAFAGEMSVVVPLPTGLFVSGDDVLVESRHDTLHYVVVDGLPVAPAEQLVLRAHGRPLGDGSGRGLKARKETGGVLLQVLLPGAEGGGEPVTELELSLDVPAPMLSLFALETDAAGHALVGLYLADGRAWLVPAALSGETPEARALPVPGIRWTDARRFVAVRADGRVVEMRTDRDGVLFLEHALGDLE